MRTALLRSPPSRRCVSRARERLAAKRDAPSRDCGSRERQRDARMPGGGDPLRGSRCLAGELAAKIGAKRYFPVASGDYLTSDSG
jgi:hypothetical protein